MNSALLKTAVLVAFLGTMGGGSPTFAKGVDRSARGLVDACQSEQPGAVNWCAGYLMGSADVLGSAGGRTTGYGLCDASYSVEDLGAIFLTFMRTNPQLLDVDMLGAVLAAFHSRWPCKAAVPSTHSGVLDRLSTPPG